MPAFVALLRGVNVGKGPRVPMAEWRQSLERLGYTRVTTLLNSGNAVFHAAQSRAERHAAAIAGALSAELRVDVPVIVKSADQFDAAVSENPLAESVTEPSRLLVAFTRDAAALAGLADLADLVVPPEQFVLGRHAAYLHCPAGILESRAGAALLAKRAQLTTTRNWATVLKLHALLQERPELPSARAAGSGGRRSRGRS
jgi:uncharacterized protein (DUF1697 family)